MSSVALTYITCWYFSVNYIHYGYNLYLMKLSTKLHTELILLQNYFMLYNTFLWRKQTWIIDHL